MSRSAVLIVEDDDALREALVDTLEMAGYPVVAVGDGAAALEALRDQPIGIMFSDVQMAPTDGFELLQQARRLRNELPVVLMTAYGTIEKAVQAIRDGATDYLVKPFEGKVLVEMTERFLAPQPAADGAELVAEDPRTLELVSLAERVAASDATVMITGESGTGKEVFARYIHEQSPRVGGPFVAINCAAIPENMLEAMLFGHEKGAYTGAHEARRGKFEQANGGTLLLDEISEMDLGLQAKLLRVLQEREVERLGARKPVPLDVRVIATSNRNLQEEVAAGRFREDLFYRLTVFPLHLTPLRERVADVVPLARAFVARHSRGRQRFVLDAGAEEQLRRHSWPGNVRELDNVIQRAMILAVGNEIRAHDIRYVPVAGVAHDTAPAQDAKPLDSNLKNRESQLIIEALKAGNGSRKQAAERLGISPRTLRYKLARMREAGIAIPC
jgi:two-component system response regulator FlrC